MKRLLHSVFSLALAALSCQPLNFALAGVPITDGEKEFDEKYLAPVTEDTLLLALRDPLPFVRTYAAARLAETWPKHAASAIMDAYTNETSPWAEVHLARIAARLGDANAIKASVGICGNPARPPNLRMVAAQAAMRSGRQDCLDDVVNLLQSSKEDWEIIEAISVLQVWQNMPAEELREVREFVPTFLKSKSIAIQIAACDFLAQFGDSSSAEQLKSAVSTEQSEIVLNVMNSALKRLEAKKTGKSQP